MNGSSFSPFDTFKTSLQVASMTAFWDLLKPILDAQSPSRLCEVGMAGGITTQVLLEYCQACGCVYAGVDPTVSDELAGRVKDRNPQNEVHKATSLSVLESLACCDVYVLDGDHNYYTIFNELAQIEKAVRAQKHPYPVVLFHDVSWPCARRDAYYNVTTIPEEWRQPNLPNDGIGPKLDRDGLEKDGFWRSGGASWALHEGGARNGVLTGIEDYLQATELKTLLFLRIPAFYGLGILYDRAALSPSARETMARFENGLELFSPTIALLERIRLNLFMEVDSEGKKRLEERLDWIESSRFWKAQRRWMSLRKRLEPFLPQRLRS